MSDLDLKFLKIKSYIAFNSHQDHFKKYPTLI